MHPSDLKWFRENVAEPAMQRLFERTTIPEGFCCVDKMDVAFFDCRNCGADSQIKVSGLQYKDGKVEAYSYEALDFDISAFAQAHQNCVFLSDGDLHVFHELEELEITSFIRNLDSLRTLCPELPHREDVSIVSESIEYLKMEHLLQKQQALNTPDHKILCAGCSDGCFFSIQQHDISSGNTYFSLYCVDTIPKGMSPDAIEAFIIEQADYGSSVAGSWEQIMDELHAFLKDSCVDWNLGQNNIPQSLADRIVDAQDKVDLNIGPAQNSREPGMDI